MEKGDEVFVKRDEGDYVLVELKGGQPFRMSKTGFEKLPGVPEHTRKFGDLYTLLDEVLDRLVKIGYPFGVVRHYTTGPAEDVGKLERMLKHGEVPQLIHTISGFRMGKAKLVSRGYKFASKSVVEHWEQTIATKLSNKKVPYYQRIHNVLGTVCKLANRIGVEQGFSAPVDWEDKILECGGEGFNGLYQAVGQYRWVKQNDGIYGVMRLQYVPGKNHLWVQGNGYHIYFSNGEDPNTNTWSEVETGPVVS